jgi:formate hydrogenlyase subunit 6/NADH:ubiquinone oxidoreductase subunit I
VGAKKERHRINPAICIDCGACGRVCPAKSVEDNFGTIAQRTKKQDWEKPFFNLESCMSCGICLDTCPAGALDANLQKVGSRHVFPFLIDDSLCMGCGFCAADCPVGAITMGRRLSTFPAPVQQVG